MHNMISGPLSELQKKMLKEVFREETDSAFIKMRIVIRRFMDNYDINNIEDLLEQPHESLQMPPTDHQNEYSYIMLQDFLKHLESPENFAQFMKECRDEMNERSDTLPKDFAEVKALTKDFSNYAMIAGDRDGQKRWFAAQFKNHCHKYCVVHYRMLQRVDPEKNNYRILVLALCNLVSSLQLYGEATTQILNLIKGAKANYYVPLGTPTGSFITASLLSTTANTAEWRSSTHLTTAEVEQGNSQLNSTSKERRDSQGSQAANITPSADNALKPSYSIDSSRRAISINI